MNQSFNLGWDTNNLGIINDLFLVQEENGAHSLVYWWPLWYCLLPLESCTSLFLHCLQKSMWVQRGLTRIKVKFTWIYLACYNCFVKWSLKDMIPCDDGLVCSYSWVYKQRLKESNLNVPLGSSLDIQRLLFFRLDFCIVWLQWWGGGSLNCCKSRIYWWWLMS